MLMQFWIKSYIHPTSIFIPIDIIIFNQQFFLMLTIAFAAGYFLCSEVSTSGAITKFNPCMSMIVTVDVQIEDFCSFLKLIFALL